MRGNPSHRPKRPAPSRWGTPLTLSRGERGLYIPRTDMTLPRLSLLMDAGARRVDGLSAAVFRIAFGLVCLYSVVRFFVHGWVGDLYIEPAHHFPYLGFGWIKPWPAWGMHVHFSLLGALALGIAAGYRYRLCAFGFFLGFTYVELIDKTNYLNHYYWVSLVSLLAVFLPLNASLSLDAWRSRRGTKKDRLWGDVPAVTIWLLRGQLAVVYLFAGIAKLNPDWLFEAQPLRIWLHYYHDTPLIGPLMDELWVAYAMSWAGAAFDLTIVGWLLWRPTRLPAYVVLAAFHLITWLLFPKIGVFPWLMTCAALLFFPPDWPRRLLARTALVSPQVPGAAHTASPHGWQAKAAAAAILLFCLAQVVVPMRHLVYPGNVRWNEEGYRFSWRVLVTEKAGYVEYHVSDPVSGKRWSVQPEGYLTPLQMERMSTQPDMVLETAHIIARDYAAWGYPEAEVRAQVFLSMNGRESRRLIDPAVNLARVDHGLGPKLWVLPRRAPATDQ